MAKETNITEEYLKTQKVSLIGTSDSLISNMTVDASGVLNIDTDLTVNGDIKCNGMQINSLQSDGVVSITNVEGGTVNINMTISGEVNIDTVGANSLLKIGSMTHVNSAISLTAQGENIVECAMSSMELNRWYIIKIEVDDNGTLKDIGALFYLDEDYGPGKKPTYVIRNSYYSDRDTYITWMEPRDSNHSYNDSLHIIPGKSTSASFIGFYVNNGPTWTTETPGETVVGPRKINKYALYKLPLILNISGYGIN